MDLKKRVVFVGPDGGSPFVLKGIRIDQLLPRENCDRFSAYRVRMEPRQVKKPSFHKRGEELYYVLSGTGTAQLGDKNFSLEPGCFFRVPPNTVHRFAAGDEPLELLNFHSPPVFSDSDTYFTE